MKYNIAVRFDDVCPCMKTENFNILCKALEEKNAFPLLGVVPCNVDENLNCVEENLNFWEEIKKLKEKGYSIAQHGTYHEYVSSNGGILNLNKRSEFAGLSYENQYEKIKKGKDILLSHGIDTNIFMAPSHSYDINTIKAAKELGFKYFTDGYTSYPYKIEGVTFIPCWALRVKKRGHFNTVCIHANILKEKNVNNLLEDFKKKNIISYENLLTISDNNIRKRNASLEKLRIRKLQIKGKIFGFIKKILKR